MLGSMGIDTGLDIGRLLSLRAGWPGGCRARRCMARWRAPACQDLCRGARACSLGAMAIDEHEDTLAAARAGRPMKAGALPLAGLRVVEFSAVMGAAWPTSAPK